MCPKRGYGTTQTLEAEMAEEKFARVRVRGTDLVGKKVLRGGAFKYYEAEGNMNMAVTPVHFEETGEVRFFQTSVLDVEPDEG